MSRRWVHLALVVAVLAVAYVVFREHRRSGDQEAWEAVAAARASPTPIDALEDARELAKGSSAEPFAAFYLAIQLEQEGLTGMRRAIEVAKAAAAAYPDHALAPMLDQLQETLARYEGG